MMQLLNGGVMDVWKDETLPSSQVGGSTWGFIWVGSRKEDLRYWRGSRKYFINATHFLSLPFGDSGNHGSKLCYQIFQENSWKLKELVGFQTA